jgi:hypothetical protein
MCSMRERAYGTRARELLEAIEKQCRCWADVSCIWAGQGIIAYGVSECSTCHVFTNCFVMPRFAHDIDER